MSPNREFHHILWWWLVVRRLSPILRYIIRVQNQSCGLEINPFHGRRRVEVE
jgi:hypothetical protein